MRFVVVALAAVALTCVARAAPYASADEVQAAIGAHRAGPLVSLGPYEAMLGFPVTQNAPVTDAQAQLVYVVAGAGILNLGGAPQVLEKGVTYIVPAGTAAQITKANGLATISIRLPAGEAPAGAKPKLFASVADFQALVAAGKNDPLVALPPLRDMFQYRKEPQSALLHAKDDEFVYVTGGMGTFTVGGTLIDPKPTGPGNTGGKGITGGTQYMAAPGALFFVPANTVHGFSGIAGVLISIDLHLPHGD